MKTVRLSKGQSQPYLHAHTWCVGFSVTPTLDLSKDKSVFVRVGAPHLRLCSPTLRVLRVSGSFRVLRAQLPLGIPRTTWEREGFWLFFHFENQGTEFTQQRSQWGKLAKCNRSSKKEHQVKTEEIQIKHELQLRMYQYTNIIKMLVYEKTGAGNSKQFCIFFCKLKTKTKRLFKQFRNR